MVRRRRIVLAQRVAGTLNLDILAGLNAPGVWSHAVSKACLDY